MTRASGQPAQGAGPADSVQYRLLIVGILLGALGALATGAVLRSLRGGGAPTKLCVDDLAGRYVESASWAMVSEQGWAREEIDRATARGLQVWRDQRPQYDHGGWQDQVAPQDQRAPGPPDQDPVRALYLLASGSFVAGFELAAQRRWTASDTGLWRGTWNIEDGGVRLATKASGKVVELPINDALLGEFRDGKLSFGRRRFHLTNR